MSRANYRFALYAVAVAAGLVLGGRALASKLVRRPQPSAVVYPKQELPLRFSHVQHLTLPGRRVSCIDCHTQAMQSRSALDNLLPVERACKACHKIERSSPRTAAVTDADSSPQKSDNGQRCETCHLNYKSGDTQVQRLAIPAPAIKFSHKSHADRYIPCSRCHGDFVRERIGLATRSQLPTMQVCLDCHDGKQAANACTTCHLAGAGGVIQTALAGGQLLPSGSLRGAEHGPDILRTHGRIAANDDSFCENCHKKDECIACHAGTRKILSFHDNDYVTLHAMDAKRMASDCSSCHRQQSFCVGCHSRSGVSADRRGSTWDHRNLGQVDNLFHPSGWVSYSGGAPIGTRGPDHHAFAAQRNIRQCASCHREDFCIQCHSAQPGAYQINPHPASWRGSRRCRALAARAGRMCLKCHVNAFEANCDFMP